MELRNAPANRLVELVRHGGSSGRLARAELERRRDNGSPHAVEALSKLDGVEVDPGLVEVGCPDCGEKACGGGHLYVIELEPDAASDTKMLSMNPNGRPGGIPLYVGSTNHTVECNFENGHLGEKGGTYLCRCFRKPTVRQSIIRPATQRFKIRRLRYDLFAGCNPVPKATVKQDEAEFAQRLKSQGYLVWQN